MALKLTRRRTLGAIAGLSAVVAAAVAITFQPPRVERVESEFGTVRETTADVNTRIVIQNPNDRRLPGTHALRYRVLLNDLAVANGTRKGVRIGPQRTVIQTTAQFDNSAIPGWWASHVNNDERTRMETRAWVGIGGLPLEISIPPDVSTITTELLDTFSEDKPSTVALGDRTILRVGEQTATWDTADEEQSPIRLSTTLENVHDRPVRIDGTDYEIRMNSVVVGSGETTDGIVLPPGESATFDSAAAIETPRMQDWWVTHLRNDQSTELHVEVLAVTTDTSGNRRRLPIAVLDQQAAFETDMLGTGETTVEPRESEQPSEFTEPSTERVRSRWGEVRNDETDIRTTVTVRNENDETFSKLVSLDLEQETVLAGITVATGSTRIETLPQGEGHVETVASKSHALVPDWWAAHLRNGERSTTRTSVTADADVGITTLPLDLDARESTVETSLLADLDDESRRTVTGSSTGWTLFVVHATSAKWEDPTPAEGTIRVTAHMENARSTPLTIREIDARVEINDVVLADTRIPDQYTFGAGERKTIAFRIPLDNSRMEAWWPTHVRNGERSRLDRRVTVTVDSDIGGERVPLEFLSETTDVETDLLADD